MQLSQKFVCLSPCQDCEVRNALLEDVPVYFHFPLNVAFIMRFSLKQACSAGLKLMFESFIKVINKAFISKLCPVCLMLPDNIQRCVFC